MTKSYCVKEKKITECIPGSEQYEYARNGFAFPVVSLKPNSLKAKREVL